MTHTERAGAVAFDYERQVWLRGDAAVAELLKQAVAEQSIVVDGTRDECGQERGAAYCKLIGVNRLVHRAMLAAWIRELRSRGPVAFELGGRLIAEAVRS